MIGYDRLGTNGRFGNQLFQYAALRGIAAHHGYDWCIPPDNHETYANYGIHHPFKLAGLDPKKNVGFVNENVSPQSMFSYGALKDTNPRTKNVTEAGRESPKPVPTLAQKRGGAGLKGARAQDLSFLHIQSPTLRSLAALTEEAFPESLLLIRTS